MKINLIYFLLLLIAYTTQIYGQQSKELTVGDPLPFGIKISNIINYKTSSVNIDDFSDKLLLLDFMATSCKSCIEVLPRLDSLQKQFGDRLQIILVTDEKKERTSNFLQKNKIGKQVKLPWILEDTILKKYFPYEFISHEVWINKGIVRAITRTNYVNSSNIEKMLAGHVVSWPIKNDKKPYDFSKPFYIINEDGIPYPSLPERSYHSAFTGYMPGIGTNSSRDTKNGYTRDSLGQYERIYMVNMPIIDLYLKSFNRLYDFSPSKIILETRNTGRYIYNSANKDKVTWMNNNSYCYEIIFPHYTADNTVREKIRNDLNFYLGCFGKMEIRKIKSLVLYRGGSSDSLLKKKIKRIAVNDDSKLIITSVKSLVSALNNNRYGCPVFDETGYNQQMYLEFPASSLLNISLLKKEVRKYGLEVKEEERMVEMFILTENGYGDK